MRWGSPAVAAVAFAGLPACLFALARAGPRLFSVLHPPPPLPLPLLLLLVLLPLGLRIWTPPVRLCSPPLPPPARVRHASVSSVSPLVPVPPLVRTHPRSFTLARMGLVCARTRPWLRSFERTCVPACAFPSARSLVPARSRSFPVGCACHRRHHCPCWPRCRCPCCPCCHTLMGLPWFVYQIHC